MILVLKSFVRDFSKALTPIGIGCKRAERLGVCADDGVGECQACDSGGDGPKDAGLACAGTCQPAGDELQYRRVQSDFAARHGAAISRPERVRVTSLRQLISV